MNPFRHCEPEKRVWQSSHRYGYSNIRAQYRQEVAACYALAMTGPVFTLPSERLFLLDDLAI